MGDIIAMNITGSLNSGAGMILICDKNCGRNYCSPETALVSGRRLGDVGRTDYLTGDLPEFFLFIERFIDIEIDTQSR